MSTCPWCGQKVPFGGGRTAKNAAKILDEVGAVARGRDLLKEAGANMDPPQPIPESTLRNLDSFITEGTKHAETFHQYSHKWSMVPPDWAAAGWWSRHAQELLVGFVRDLAGGPA